MPTRAPFGLGEWYHCYNRGVDKRRTFISAAEYVRFQTMLYTCNSQGGAHFGNLHGRTLSDLSAEEYRATPLVSVGAYVLMPNHFHLVLLEKTEGGISRFMQKLMTGYTLYFNQRHERTGALFGGSYKSKIVPTDRYFKHLISYVHLNPAELFGSHWKKDMRAARRALNKVTAYPFSSLIDFCGNDRPERVILGDEIFSLYDAAQPIAKTAEQALAYYARSEEPSPERG